MHSVPRYRRAVVVLLVTLAPVASTMNFVSLSAAAHSATRELHFQTATQTMPSWSEVTGWAGRSFHFGAVISAPHIVGPISNR
jgi:hypothetical protein